MPTIYDSVADTAGTAIFLEVGSPHEFSLTQAELDSAGTFGNPEYDYFEFFAKPFTTYTVQVLAGDDLVDGALWLPSPTWPGYDSQFGFTAPAGSMVTLENGYSVRNWDPGDRLVTTLNEGGLVRMAVRFDGWAQEYSSGEDFSDLPASDRRFFLRVVEGDVAGTKQQIDLVGTGNDAVPVAPENAALTVGELEDLDGVADIDDYIFTLRAGFHYDVVVRGTTGAQSGEIPETFRVTVSEVGGASSWSLESDIDQMSIGNVEQTITSVRIGDNFGDPHLEPGEEVDVRVSVESVFDPDREVGPYHTGGFSVGGFEIEIVPLDDDHGNNRLSPSSVVIGEWVSGTLDSFYEISEAEPFGDRDWMEIVGGVEKGRYYVASFDYEEGRPSSMFAGFHNAVSTETVRAPDYAIWRPQYTGAAWLEVDSDLEGPADWRLIIGSYETLERGNRSNERLAGSSSDNFLDGRMGRDTLIGKSGDDQLIGGRGNDTLRGGVGQDFLKGGNGRDQLKGNGGKDNLYGDAGRDTIFGGGGADTLYGGDGKDHLIGGSGKDVLFGGVGRDKLIGGGGSDIITAGLDGDIVRAGRGSDTIIVKGSEGGEALKIKGSVETGDVLDLAELEIESYFVDDVFVGGGISSMRSRQDGLGFDIDLNGDAVGDRSILFDSAENADLIVLEGVARRTPEALYEYLDSTLPLLQWTPTAEWYQVGRYGRASYDLLSGTNESDFIRNDGLENLAAGEDAPYFDGHIKAFGGDDIIDIQPGLAIEVYGGTGDDFFVWHPPSLTNRANSVWLNDFRQNGEMDFIVVKEEVWGSGTSIDNITFYTERGDGDFLEARIKGTNGLEGSLYVRQPFRSSDSLLNNDATSADFLSEDAFIFV